MQSLPPELWFLITASVLRSDLPSLARVSSAFLEIARKKLYLHVALQNYDIPYNQTLSLLLTNHDIAQSIETLQLKTSPLRRETLNWISVDVMKGLLNLRSLILIRKPFITDEDESNFFETVREFCPLLRVFSYCGGVLGTSRRQMALISRRLQRLTWGVRNPFSGFYLHSPTANFFSTLTHLSFPATVDDFEAEHLIPFSTLRFQSLYSFKIGSWDVDASEPCTALTQFLIAHPTLHELALGYASDGLFYGDLDPNVIRPDMLPNLQRLEAHARIVTMLAEKDCKCLDDISSLSTGQGLYHNALDDVEDMLMQLAMRNGLPRVNHLSFMAGDWASDREDNGDFFSWMEGFADICPNLEVWSGPLPKISLNMLTLVLGRFAKLQEIEERSWSVSELSSTTMIDVVRRIASQCPSLRHFDLKAQLKPQRYTIFRDSAGLMSSTVLSSLNDEFWLSDNWS